MKIYLETMGCQMNRLDSELAGSAPCCAAGHEMVDDARTADVLLYNTCSVRQHAEDKVALAAGCRPPPQGGFQGQSKKKILVGVLGCMAQRCGEELLSRYLVWTSLAGPGQLVNVPAMIAQAAAGRPARRWILGTTTLARPMAMPGRRTHATASTRLDLARDITLHARRPPRPSSASRAAATSSAAYCVVPFVRGPERSRRPERIAGGGPPPGRGRPEPDHAAGPDGQQLPLERRRAERCASATCWRPLVAVPGLRRLRFVTSHPLDFGDDMLEAMRDLPNVCPYIHLPAQSGCDAVLQADEPPLHPQPVRRADRPLPRPSCRAWCWPATSSWAFPARRSRPRRLGRLDPPQRL